MTRSSLRDGAFVIVDQFVSSITNAVIGIGGALLLTRNEYADIAVPFAFYALALAVARSWLGDLIGARWDGTGERTSSAAAAGLLLGVPAALLSLVGGALSSDAGPWVALAISWPFLLALDTCRYESIAADGGRRAMTLDIAWLMLAGAGFVLVGVLSTFNASNLMAVWCVGGALAWMLVTRLESLRALRGGIEWLRTEPHDARRLFVENLAARSTLPMLVLIGGAVLTKSEVALFSFARSAAAPVTVVYVAFLAFAVPALRSGRWPADGLVMRFSPGAYGLVCSVGVIAGFQVLQSTQFAASAYDVGVVAAMLASVAASGFALGIRAEMRAKQQLVPLARTQVVAGLVAFGGGIAGLAVERSALWMTIGVAAATALTIPLWMRQTIPAAQLAGE